jgi:hypothetical protein
MFFFMYLAVHMEDQFADSRARLAPGYRRVHATIAAAVALVFAVLLPAMFTWLLDRHSIGFVAIAVLLFGATLWMMSSRDSWLSPLIAVALISLVIEPVRGCLHQLVSGQFEPQAVGILVLGVLIALLAGMRLVRLDEDTPEYRRRIAWDWAERNQTSRLTWPTEGRILPGLWDWLAARQVARLVRHARRASESPWSRVCRWQVGMPTGWTVLAWALGAVLYMHCLTWWIMPRQPANGGMSIGMVSFFFTIIPAVGVLGSLQRRTHVLGHELVMPVVRRTYVKELGAAAALSGFQVWAGMCTALGLWWLLTAGQPRQLGMLANILLISGACQICMFGAFACLASFRSKALAILAILLVVPQILLIAQIVTDTDAQYKTLLAAGITATLGLLFIWIAYRRWLKVDFD